jgi:hypothetical protein
MSAPFLLEQSEVKHTPGPWRAEFGEAIVVKGADGARVAIATNLDRYGRRDTNEVEANARLIAASPELLEALRELHEAESARFPPAEAGQDAQTAWATRIDVAHALAAAAIRKATLGSAS